MITVVAAAGGLFLGVRSEQRAGREEQRAAAERRHAVEESRKADLKALAEQIDFYRTRSTVVVMNSNRHPLPMRLVLPERHVWWNLYSLRPCSQIKIPTDDLRASMRKAVPSVWVTDGELSSLWLEFGDGRGNFWIRSGSGGALVSSPREAQRGVQLVDSDEGWIKTSEDSPICGAP
ncbi:hypothetical protein [Streptomyces sp. NPDC091209]|uniref:hypothetical protein n=1 Tax=Streptomyces sp. NPDC091209 TaxID=3365974 RepID=UPI0037FA8843